MSWGLELTLILLLLMLLGLTVVFVMWLINIAKMQKARTNVDALIGQQALLLEDYEFLQPATIKLGDIIWRVKTINNQPLKKHSLVEVVGIEGNTLIVKEKNK